MFALPRETARVRGVDLAPLVDLKSDVLDSHGVVAMLSIVGRSYPQHRSGRRILQIHHFLGPSIGRIPNALRPTQRFEQVEIEPERPLDVGDRKIDVVDSLCGHAPAAVKASAEGLRLDRVELLLGDRARVKELFGLGDLGGGTAGGLAHVLIHRRLLFLRLF